MLALKLLRQTLRSAELQLEKDNWNLNELLSELSRVGDTIFRTQDRIQRLKAEIEILENMEKK